jgi:ATP-dependent Clp protease ATP-binding subunit ClpA
LETGLPVRCRFDPAVNRFQFDIQNSAQFLDTATESAREFLLCEGTDLNYGARPLKRAIERLLVHPRETETHHWETARRAA